MAKKKSASVEDLLAVIELAADHKATAESLALKDGVVSYVEVEVSIKDNGSRVETHIPRELEV